MASLIELKQNFGFKYAFWAFFEYRFSSLYALKKMNEIKILQIKP